MKLGLGPTLPGLRRAVKSRQLYNGFDRKRSETLHLSKFSAILLSANRHTLDLSRFQSYRFLT